MRKFIIACAVATLLVTGLVLKINYEQHKSDQEMERQGKSMCETKVINC